MPQIILYDFKLASEVILKEIGARYSSNHNLLFKRKKKESKSVHCSLEKKIYDGHGWIVFSHNFGPSWR